MEFALNASNATMLLWLSCASIGLSTMVDEHIVIDFVGMECQGQRSSGFSLSKTFIQTAGLIPVTHGPLNDIVIRCHKSPTGLYSSFLNCSSICDRQVSIRNLPSDNPENICAGGAYCTINVREESAGYAESC